MSARLTRAAGLAACLVAIAAQSFGASALAQAAGAARAGDRIAGPAFATRSPVIARNGAAATAHPLATNVALDILKRGGSAVDAAIAVNAALGVLEPTGNGIGGDLFALVWDPKTGRLHGLNASGRAPMGMDPGPRRRWLRRLSGHLARPGDQGLPRRIGEPDRRDGGRVLRLGAAGAAPGFRAGLRRPPRRTRGASVRPMWPDAPPGSSRGPGRLRHRLSGRGGAPVPQSASRRPAG
jgi:Gamma-glutamyltranspeptidase